MIALLARFRAFVIRSQKTAERLKRTVLQVAAGGALGGLFSAVVMGTEAAQAFANAGATAVAAFVAAWAQNTLEDARPDRDRRP